MSKIKVNHKNSQVNVISKLDWKEAIDYREIEIFNNNNIQGIMKVTVQGKRKLSYYAPIGISLAEYLQKGIQKEDFFRVLIQLLNVMKRIEIYRLNLENLVLDLKYTYINTSTKVVHFVYQPLCEQKVSYNIFSYIYEMIRLTVLETNENEKFLNELWSYLKKMQYFSIPEIEIYIKNQCPEIFWKFNSDHGAQAGRINKKYPPNEEDTSVMSSDGGYDEEDTTIMNPVGGYDEEDTTVMGTDGTYYGEKEQYETTLLQEENETTLLDGADENVRKEVFPYLIHKSTQIRTEVDKPIFRIGKEKSYVDYFISNNNAVSRIHADIISRDGEYYIRDCNSTNHTYINGKRIPVNSDIQIENGEQIRLANEEFEFWC